MENLIDFGDPQAQPKSQNSPSASNKLFGVIKRECFAVEVAGMDDGVGENLKPGILIQIIPDYKGDQCHFKIRNFSNWQDKYKTVIYKCKKDDYIVVTGELWPYLLALKNDEGRVKLVQKVYNKEFDLDMLKLGSQIRIRGPPGTYKYYEFRVAYNGVVKEIGTGYYIGLQLKSDGVSLTSDLKVLSRYYRFGGTIGIVVPLDWIMLNLYKEEHYCYIPPIIPLNKVSDVEMTIIETAAEAQENSSDNVQEHLHLIEQRKKTNEIGALSKICYSAPNCVPDTTLAPPMKSFETRATSKQNDQPHDTTPNFVGNRILEETKMEHNYGSRNIENNYLRRTPIIAQPSKTIEAGAMSTQRQQSPENPKTECNNNAVESMPLKLNDWLNNYVRTSLIVSQSNKTIEPDAMLAQNHQNPKVQFNNNAAGPMQIKPNDRMKNTDNNYVRTSPTEIGIMPRHHHQSLENPSHVTSNYVAEIELINNLDGAVRNVERTKCDLCSMAVEISHGIILRECLHSFCKRCIAIHVITDSNDSRIRCPYKKDYDCEYNLLDSEIKDLGGEIIYNKILENRLKEYVGADPNATRCPNMNCGFVWVNIRRKHINYENCPNCNAGWCFVCQSAHERGERHGNNLGKPTMFDKIKSKMFGTDPPQPTVDCAKCRTTNISATGYVRLQNCNHTICKTCILPMIKSQTSGSRYAQCTVCNISLEDKELVKIAGLEVLNLFLGNRKIQNDSAVLQEICICGSSVSNCSVELKCTHKFCRTCIVGLVQEQFSSSNRAACPRCLQEIDKSQIRRLESGLIKEEMIPKSVSPKEMCVCKLPNANCQFILKCNHTFCRTYIAGIVENQLNSKGSAACPTCSLEIDKFEIEHLIPGQIKSELVNKCHNCSNQAEVHLTNCQHRFCLKCFQNIITTQIFDPKKSFVTCTSCDENVADREISAYGSEELFARYKTKFGATPHHITLNEKPFECDMCEKEIPIKGGIILSGCKHWFCIKCCKELIDRQLSIAKQPVCSICLKELAQYEIEALIRKPPNDNSTLVECLKCEQKFDARLIQKCSKCTNLICLKCAKATFEDQIRIGTTPSCPVCRNMLDKSEISSIINGVSSVQPPSDDHNEIDSLHSAENPFECIMCEQSPDHPSDKILLINCKHQVCFKCLKEQILAQLKWTQTPMCPFCKGFIDPVQLVGFGFSKVSRAAVELEEPSTCFLCKNRIQQKVDLKNCGHEFCGQCIHQFTKNQQSNGFAPSCPTCRKLIKNDQFIEFQSLPPVSRTYYNLQQNNDSKTPLQLNKSSFDCPRCDNKIDSECGISLIDCGHLFCRDCISIIILERSKNNLVPFCPLCEKKITVEQIHALGSEVNAIPTEKQLGFDIFTRGHEVQTQQHDGPPSSDIDRLSICVICNENKATYAPSNCNDRFCRPCMKNVLINQSLNNKIPSCPKCFCIMSGLEVNELCGIDVYKRFVENNRKM